ncbi:hypothetical protein [Aquimarina algicola]|uniref:Lipoprotein n=1 Tax=Aquimarina algicola TaxID=2589995 RepID=A0A504JF80_9FLAO|nr:hypothetical protein [Aquimarina algicola]TPN86283.1 hypothetical protein FHK87_13535 [Aquimarina algicola]
MINRIIIIPIVSFLLTSCFSTTFNKRKFKKFNPPQSQNKLIKKNGYYFYETEVQRYYNWVPNGSGANPTDSILTKIIRGILFYDNSKVYVTNYFDGLKYDDKKSLEIAQKKLEKRIYEFGLKTIDKEKTHISTLGKYAIHNDTITIQYFRFSSGDRYLTELKGTLKENESFNLFQKIDFYGSLFEKPKSKMINMDYTFKEY